MASGLAINRQAVEKLQNYLNDSSYRDAVENSASYNTRISLEKKMRLPFLDAQTGVAQNHCTLWMEPRHRMPGEKPGQMYTYPARRWKKKRRSYLTNFMQLPRKKEIPQGDNEVESVVVPESVAVVVQANNEDSKDSTAIGVKDEGSKEAWLYEELQAEADDFEEPEADSDYDYEESYSKRKKKKATPKATPKATVRGRKKQIPVNYDATDTEKPYSCETCGARYKTRPGLTYHYTHTHKNLLEDDDDDSSAGNSGSTPMSSAGTPLAPPHSNVATPGASSSTPTYMETPTGSSRGRSSRQGAQQPQQPVQVPQPQQQQHLQPMGGGPSPLETTPRRNNPPPAPYNMMHVPVPVVQQPPASYGMPVASPAVREMEMRPRAAPSSYCDFCLGDATENKKTGQSEELVSCADCGRSGHPSCLQFTPNMIISVKQYRWQCIECKCCSLCGNSDNDDQLLFCDDCDRGYHMYCLKPPLTEPPEGSWSCHLCLVVFHRK